jgi:O-antigen ligase
VTSFFGDEKILGSYLSKMWPIFFGLSILINKQNKRFTYLLVLIFILSESLIFLSGERAAFFFINLSTVFILIFSKNLFKLRLISFLASVLLLIIISNFYPIAKQRIIDLSLEQINLVDRSIKKNKEIYIFSKEHTMIYKAAYKIFLDNKLLGVGVKNFRTICKKEKYNTHRDSCSTHPHNTYMQILTETGIIGFSFLIFIFFYFIKHLLLHVKLKLKRKKYFNDFEICLLSAILIYLWPIAPTGNIFNNWLNIPLILNLAFLAWSRKIIK